MSEFLFEILCEEIPARMQEDAQNALEKALGDHLKAAGLTAESMVSLSGPRRLVAWVDGLAKQSSDKTEERKGPKVGAPDKAIAGFLRGAGLNDISEAEIVDDPRKGPLYVARKTIKGRATKDILAEIMPQILSDFSWPKSMKSGSRSERWVRPVNRLLCLFDGEVVDFEWAGIASGAFTEGHRFFGRGPYEIADFADYRAKLEGEGHVILDLDVRKTLIQNDAKKVCHEAGLELVDDPKLVNELAGLAEWPVVLLGEMDEKFLRLPDEVIQLSMRTHQKYLAVRQSDSETLAPNFVVVANIPAKDGGAKIKAGNARVLSARLSDAEFFWDQDLAQGLEKMGEKLSTIKFKAELGSMADKTGRVVALASKVAEYVSADSEDVAIAAKLLKNDLASQMVYEFPELQGQMGRYYAKAGGANVAVSDAIADHYRPLGPAEEAPDAPVSIVCALADKLDTLVGFWIINEKPSGSKDPFALRRAALGVVRILLENQIRLPLRAVLQNGLDIYALKLKEADCLDSLLEFFSDRLGQYLKAEGVGHDRIAAVFALGLDDLKDIADRAKALEVFLQSDDGKNLLAGYKRANNILKQGKEKSVALDQALFTEDAEISLNSAMEGCSSDITAAIKAEDYNAAMMALAKLRQPLDAFFDSVMVNDEDPKLKSNRHALLQTVVSAMSKIAYFDKIQD